MESEPRSSQIYHAKLTEYAERSEDMVDTMDKIAQGGIEMTVEERNLFSVAYKNMMDPLRKSWQWISDTLDSISSNKEMERAILEGTKRDIERNIKSLCYRLVEMVDAHILPLLSSAESRVFFHKMKGDYLRYVAATNIEIKGEAWVQVVDTALQSYQRAANVAAIELTPTHPIRLGLALNFSVFYYDIVRKKEHACVLAKQAFDDSMAELDTMEDETSGDSMVIMHLLRKSLTDWSKQCDV